MTTTDLIVEVAKTLDATRQQEVLAFARRLQARGGRPQRGEVLTHMRRLAEGAGRDCPAQPSPARGQSMTSMPSWTATATITDDQDLSRRGRADPGLPTHTGELAGPSLPRIIFPIPPQPAQAVGHDRAAVSTSQYSWPFVAIRLDYACSAYGDAPTLRRQETASPEAHANGANHCAIPGARRQTESETESAAAALIAQHNRIP